MKRLHLLFLLIVSFFFARSNAQFINPPVLRCITVDGNQDINLEWSVPVNSCGPFSAYYLYRSTNFTGPYSLVATITNQLQTTHTDLVGNGGSVTYYYYMVSDFNCPGFIALSSDTFDNIDPVAPKIDSVSVVGGLAKISWQPSVSPEASGYVIYQINNGVLQNIATVLGKTNTTFIHATSTPQTDTMIYTIATFDSCMNLGFTIEPPQHSILLSDTVLRCTQQIILNWCGYDNWKNGVQQYDLYVAKNGAPPVFVKTYPTNKFSDTLTGFNDKDLLCFTLVATENITAVTSTSNEACVTLNVVQPAKDFYVRNVTVIAPNKIAVYYSMHPLADITSIEIDRAVDENNFSKLAVFAPPSDLSITNVFIDSTVLTSKNSYYYRFVATDSCGSRDTSTIGKSVLLEGYAFSDLTFYVKWDESFFDHGKVLSYDLFRDDGLGFNPLTSLLPDAFTYEEKNLPTTTPCYYLEAIDSVNFPNGTKDTIHSRSNVLCLNQPSQIYMPNAFAPQGKNSIFIPVLNVQGVSSYSFSVFDRWGQELFATNNPTEGWDGIFKGKYVQQGAYAYVVQLIDDAGKNIEVKGMVVVVR